LSRRVLTVLIWELLADCFVVVSVTLLRRDSDLSSDIVVAACRAGWELDTVLLHHLLYLTDLDVVDDRGLVLLVSHHLIVGGIVGLAVLLDGGLAHLHRECLLLSVVLYPALLNILCLSVTLHLWSGGRSHPLEPWHRSPDWNRLTNSLILHLTLLGQSGAVLNLLLSAGTAHVRLRCRGRSTASSTGCR